MPSTHSSLFYHFVFSTKNRQPWLTSERIQRIHEYLGGTIRQMEGNALAVGGIEDHVHILATLKPSYCISHVMRDAKANSSRWIREEMQIPGFSWQEGFGVFSVSASNVERVRSYILNQQKHHQKTGFEDEYLKMLKAGLVEFDERYVFD